MDTASQHPPNLLEQHAYNLLFFFDKKPTATKPSLSAPIKPNSRFDRVRSEARFCEAVRLSEKTRELLTTSSLAPTIRDDGPAAEIKGRERRIATKASTDARQHGFMTRTQLFLLFGDETLFSKPTATEHTPRQTSYRTSATNKTEVTAVAYYSLVNRRKKNANETRRCRESILAVRTTGHGIRLGIDAFVARNRVKDTTGRVLSDTEHRAISHPTSG